MSQALLVSSDEEEGELCPVCAEVLTPDDLHFIPCPCGFQVCVWCFHKIRETGNGLCPACRTAYKDENIRFRDQARTTGNDGRAPESSASSRQRSSGSARPGKPSASKASGTGTGKPSATGRAARGTRVRDRKKPTLLSKAARRNLANVRVVQRNLVYVVGLAPDIAREDTLRKDIYFGQYGAILKMVVVNHSRGGGSVKPSASAYVTFAEEAGARACIRAIDGVSLSGRTIRASFGTTKYCNQFLRGQSCTNRDCLYLHELGQEDASFTKEEMQGGQAFHELTHLAASAEAAASAANARAGAAATAPPPAPVAAVASKESTSGAGAGNVWAKGAPTPQVEPPAVKRSVSTGPPSRRNGVAAGAGSAPGGKKSVQLTQADFPSLGDTPAAAPAPVITAAGASAAKRALSHVTRSRSVPSHATAAPAEGAPPPPPMTWASKAKVAPPRTRGARAPSADSDAGAATTAPAPTTAAPSPAAPSTAAPLPVPVPATISEPSAVHAPQPTDASAGALPAGLASTAPLFSDVSPMWPPSSLGGPGAPVLGAGGPGSGLLPLAGAGGGGGLNLGWASGVPGGEAPPPTSSGFPSTWLSGALDAPAPFGDTGAAGGLLGLGPTPALGGGVPSTASNGLPIPPFGAGRYGGDEAAKDDLSLLLAGTQHLVVSDVAASAGRPQGVRDMSASGSRYSFANAAGGDDNAWGMGLGIGAPPVGEAGSGLGLGLPLGTSGAGDSGVGFGLGMGSSGAGADPNEAKAWLRAVLPTVNVTFSEGGIDNARAPGGPATRSPALAPSTPVSPLLSGMPGVWAPPAGAPGSPRVKQLRPDPADAWGENGPMPPLSLEAVGGMLPDSTQEQWSLHRNDDAGVGAGVFEQADTPSFLRPAPASSPPQVGGTSAPMADAAAGARPRGAAAGGVRGKHGKQGKGKRVGEDGGARRGRARGYGARDTGAQQPPHGDGTKNHVVAIVSTSAPLSPQRPAPVIKGKTGHPSHSGRGRHSNNKKRGKGFATQRGRHGAAPTATNKAQGAGSAAQTSFAQHPAVPSVGAGAGRPAGRRGGRGRGGGAAPAAPAASASARGSAPSSSTGNGQPQSSKRRKARGVGAKGGGQRRRGGRRA